MAKTRVNHMLGKHALKTIQSSDDDRMYTTVTDAALYMATAGYLDEANQLLVTLWKPGWPHSRNTWLADQAMEVLWAAAGARPPDVPFPQQSIDMIEVAHRRYMAIDRWTISLQQGSWQDLTGLALFRRSCQLACPNSFGRLPSPDVERDALLRLDKYVAQFDDDQPAYLFAIATCLAAELAARNGIGEGAIAYARRWAEQYPRHQYIFPTMASNRHVAPLLLSGSLAKPLGLTSDACQVYLRDLQAAVEARMRGGRTLVYGSWSCERLLKAISKQALLADHHRSTSQARTSGWLGRAPAPEEAIVVAEQRLGVALPADYRAFLSVSNGLAALSVTIPGLVPVEEIAYLHMMVDAELLAILKEYPGDDMPAALDTAVLVSERDAEEMVLLIPPQAADKSWRVWFFAHWVPGEIRYPSFRHYLEQAFQDLQAQNR